ncbi:arsenate reductase family protein [Brevundimonas sp.]|uniref:arsenate reductase family protein n=1 Tax=Brevundimonas sp. TaxID=1871086 RepID=UPI003BA9848E
MSVTLFHKPTCSTSRNALALLRERGIEPIVVDYMKVGWDRATLERLGRATGDGVRGLLRTKEPAAKALLDADDETLMAAMVADPVLVERPIVETPKGARIGRPVERVLEVL